MKRTATIGLLRSAAMDALSSLTAEVYSIILLHEVEYISASDLLDLILLFLILYDLNMEKVLDLLNLFHPDTRHLVSSLWD